MRTAYFMRARAVVNGVDPLGLITLGCPEDEYDPEVEDLVKWRGPVDAGRVIEVFVHWFGEEGRIGVSEAAWIAEGINRAREDLPPDVETPEA